MQTEARRKIAIDPYPPDKFRLLVVDDEEGPRRAIEAALYKENNLSIRAAPSGEEALAAVREGNIDLVLTDIRMPQMDGIGLLRKIREESPATVVILMTGYGSLDSAIEAIRSGAYDYLTKPFKVEELCLVVRRAVENIRLIRENENLMAEIASLLGKINKNLAESETAGSEEKQMELLRQVRRELSRIVVRKGGNGKGKPRLSPDSDRVPRTLPGS